MKQWKCHTEKTPVVTRGVLDDAQNVRLTCRRRRPPVKRRLRVVSEDTGIISERYYIHRLIFVITIFYSLRR